MASVRKTGIKTLVGRSLVSLSCALVAVSALTESSAEATSTQERPVHVRVTPSADTSALDEMPALATRLTASQRATRVDMHYRELLDGRRWRPGSRSVGNTSHGSLKGAHRIAEQGEHHYVLSAHRGRVTRYGTDELVGAVLRAAQAVEAQFPGVKTGIGNFSYESGGDIPWSVSHNSGRDADIAFFFRDERGRHVAAPTLLRIAADAERVVGRAWTLDVPASWAFVEALVQDEAARIQWIFVSDPIRARLLAYAREVGAAPAAIDAASRVLRQPGRAAPHDDHFHLRVHCSVRDRLDGCVEWGPRRPGVDYADARVRARIQELIRGLGDPQPAVAEAALVALEGWEPREGADLIAKAMVEAPTAAQARLVRVGAMLGGDEILAALERVVVETSDESAALEAIGAIASYGSTLRAPALARVVFAESAPLTRRMDALVRLQASIDSETIPLLVQGLASVPHELLAGLQTTLRRFTLHRPDAEALDAHAAWRAWNEWLEEAQAKDPDAAWAERRVRWFDAAFARAGFEIGTSDAPNLDELVRAVEFGPDELAFNADRRLILSTNIALPGSAWSGEERARLWRRRAAAMLASSADR